MPHKFPIIKNISEVLPAIQGADEFIIKRDPLSGIMVVNYIFTTSSSFPDPNSFDDPEQSRYAAIRRECRGLKFALNTGDVVTRPFHKFFNLQEKPETQVQSIDWSEPHLVLEKLDGSQLHDFVRTDGIREWHTKMGATEVAKPVEKFVAASGIQYGKFCDMLREQNYNPLFEWCSQQQRIVINYPVEQLILTAIRHKITGEYVVYDDMMLLAKSFDIPVVRALPGSITNIHEFMEAARDLEGAEGYVIRFNDGRHYKIKGAQYCAIHGTKDALSVEKNVWSMILNEQVDDIKPFMDDSDRMAVERFANHFMRAVEKQAASLVERVNLARQSVGDDRKRFAIECANAAGVLAYEKALMFSIYEGKNPIDVVLTYLRKNCGSRTKIESIRSIVGGLSWDRYFKPVDLDS